MNILLIQWSFKCTTAVKSQLITSATLFLIFIKFLNQYQTESIQLREAKNPEDLDTTIPEIITATISSVTVPVTVTAITTVAGFIAGAIKASKLLLLTDVAGVKDENDKHIVSKNSVFFIVQILMYYNFIKINKYLSYFFWND